MGDVLGTEKACTWKPQAHQHMQPQEKSELEGVFELVTT
jgi:hypothetical protein